MTLLKLCVVSDFCLDPDGYRFKRCDTRHEDEGGLIGTSAFMWGMGFKVPIQVSRNQFIG